MRADLPPTMQVLRQHHGPLAGDVRSATNVHMLHAGVASHTAWHNTAVVCGEVTTGLQPPPMILCPSKLVAFIRRDTTISGAMARGIGIDRGFVLMVTAFRSKSRTWPAVNANSSRYAGYAAVIEQICMQAVCAGEIIESEII